MSEAYRTRLWKLKLWQTHVWGGPNVSLKFFSHISYLCMFISDCSIYDVRVSSTASSFATEFSRKYGEKCQFMNNLSQCKCLRSNEIMHRFGSNRVAKRVSFKCVCHSNNNLTFTNLLSKILLLCPDSRWAERETGSKCMLLTTLHELLLIYGLQSDTFQNASTHKINVA